VPETEEAVRTAAAGLDRDFIRGVFRAMLKARLLESKLSSLYKAGKIVGGVYLGKGQEAVSAALGASLTKGRDIFAPLIRDQAGRTAFGETMLDCTRTYLGSVLGPMRGRDGNIHRGRPLEGMPAMISHLGASVSVVAGMLIARRMKGELRGVVGATCVGDGATSTGSLHEGLNMAAVENLPLVLVVSNNQFAYSTPTDRQFACEDLLDRAKGYGVGGHSVDGTDMLACATVIGRAVQLAREGDGPQMVVARLLRLSGHGEHDDASYVPNVLKAGQLGRDCLEIAMAEMVAGSYATEEEIERWKTEFTDEVQVAVAQAQQEPTPDPWDEQWDACSTPTGRL
jgi:pyruvate dehydrogenase E1 component alpha subunit/2-oxoisovalerate dehydrogenase E1 component alpha subunit